MWALLRRQYDRVSLMRPTPEDKVSRSAAAASLSLLDPFHVSRDFPVSSEQFELWRGGGGGFLPPLPPRSCYSCVVVTLLMLMLMPQLHEPREGRHPTVEAQIWSLPPPTAPGTNGGF